MYTTKEADLRAITETAERIVKREVMVNVSALVDTLTKASDQFQMGGLVERYAKIKPETQQALSLFEKAAELCAPVEDYEEAARQEGWTRLSDVRGFYLKAGETTRHMYESWQDLCEYNGLEPYQREVCEHWVVSKWLAEKLGARGERVDMDFEGLCVWGRTTTGQGIAMDGVIQEIASEACASIAKEIVKDDTTSEQLHKVAMAVWKAEGKTNG